jgi:predicted O-linked N-acetylglucosamine transferase (SPINDLY family)
MESFAAALELYRLGQFAGAEAACERLLPTATVERCDALTLLAELRTSAGRVDAAIESLRELATLAPRDAANLRRLGAALLSIGKAAEADDVLRRAIEIEPDNIRGHNNLGQVLLHLGRPQDAVACFEQALILEPRYAIGRLNLAIGLERTNQSGQALENYDRLLSFQPRFATAWTRRGVLLLRLNRVADALHSFAAAESLQPDDAPTLALKAAALLALERPTEALAAADRALVLGESTTALQHKAAALCQLRRPEEALRCIEEALEAAPGDVEAWCNCALIHQQLGDQASAVQRYRHALALDPACVAARAGLLSALIPAVPLSTAESQQARAEFEQELGNFEGVLDGRVLEETEAWTIARQHLFYLSYQEVSNKAPLQRYRQAGADRLAPFLSPSQRAQAYAAPWGRRFRLGIVSGHVYDHSVFDAITRGWLEKLNCSRFETTLFSLGTQRDAAFDAARACVDRCEAQPRSLPEWARCIREQELDALIFPEVGINRNTLALASLRLAPRQYAAWGHPETTGLPTIDAFLSADAFEPEGAQEHYSERLIRLPNLGVYYRPYGVDPAPLDLVPLGIEPKGCVFVCPGAPFKYRPEDDAVLVEIAQRVGRCTFVFFAYERPILSNRLRARLSSAFTEAGMDSRMLVFVPWQPRAAFLGLLSQADVYLDTIGFSGFNTLMHAVETRLPCVAYEGRFMRGRLGSGILRRLALDELVAADKQAYIDIAVHLSEDAGYRRQISQRLHAAAQLAYEDLSAVEVLEGVLLA